MESILWKRESKILNWKVLLKNWKVFERNIRKTDTFWLFEQGRLKRRFLIR